LHLAFIEGGEVEMSKVIIKRISQGKKANSWPGAEALSKKKTLGKKK